MTERWYRLDGRWVASGSRKVYDTATGYTTVDAGAVLPVTDPLPSGPGVTLRYVAPSGNDSNTGVNPTNNPVGTGPKFTLQAAVNAASAGTTIVMRGGTYRAVQQRVSIGSAKNNVEIRAYPGETPILDGTLSISAGSMSTSGSLRFFSYNSVPAKKNNADGVSLLSEDFYPIAQFDDGGNPVGLAAERGWADVSSNSSYSIPATQNEASKTANARIITGLYPDQCWAGGAPLKQVFVQSLVQPGYFYVSRTPTGDDPELSQAVQMYVHQDDAALGIEVSERVDDASPYLFLVDADNVTIRGIRVVGYSVPKTHFAVQVQPGTSGSTLEDMEFLDTASTAIKVFGNDTGTIGNLSQLVSDTTLRRVSVKGTGWLGMSFQYSDDTLVTGCVWEDINQYGDQTNSPKNGAIKGSRNHRFTFEHSAIRRVTMAHGLWLDQSNYDTVVASSEFLDIDAASLFYEISHGLLLVNTLFIKPTSGENVRVAGAGAVRAINNTFIGGTRTWYFIAELRGQTTANGELYAEHNYRYDDTATPSYSSETGYANSDLDQARPGARFAEFLQPENLTPGMDWLADADEFVNNVIVHTAGSGIAAYWRPRSGDGSVQLDPATVMPGWMDGNIYQSTISKLAQVHTNNSGVTGYIAEQSTIEGWRSALSAGYWSGMQGKDALGLDGGANAYVLAATGEPTSTLQTLHGTAAVAPSDAAVTLYVPGSNRHFGAYLYSSEA